MSRYPGGYKHTQVVWEDLRAWVEQLWGSYGCLVKVEVCLMPSKTHVASAVVCEFTRPLGTSGQTETVRRWLGFDTRTVGGAESAAIQVVSRFLLDLEQLTRQAEQRTLL